MASRSRTPARGWGRWCGAQRQRPPSPDPQAPPWWVDPGACGLPLYEGEAAEAPEAEASGAAAGDHCSDRAAGATGSWVSGALWSALLAAGEEAAASRAGETLRPLPRFRNIDQSPFHKIEAGSQEFGTLAMQNAPTVPLLEGHAATRERISLNSVVTVACDGGAGATGSLGGAGSAGGAGPGGHEAPGAGRAAPEAPAQEAPPPSGAASDDECASSTRRMSCDGADARGRGLTMPSPSPFATFPQW